MRERPAAGRLTSHVLDLVRARPAQGVRIEVYRVREEAGGDDGGSRAVPEASAGQDRKPGDFAGSGVRTERLAVAWTNADGRLDEPLLSGDAFVEGTYDLVFHTAEYWAGAGLTDTGPISEVSARLRVSDPRAHYHLPLLLSPGGVAVYRGS